MRESRELLCGLTYYDIISCAGMNQKEAAKKLGVGHNWFHLTLKRFGMTHWFPPVREPKPRCLSKEDIVSVAAEGFTIKDSAPILGVSYSYLQVLINHYGLRSHFPATGQAAHIGKRGYCN